MVGAADQNPADPAQAPAALTVWILDVRPNQIKVGTRVFLPGYTIFGDEGGIGVVHEPPVIEARPRRGRR